MDVQGDQRAGGNRFAVAVSRFNLEITQGLLRGAMAALEEAGAQASAHTVVWVPGAFELPLTAQRLAESGDYDAIICLGCLIKGDTMHFEYIAEAASNGIAQVAAVTGVPITFGVLTTMTEEQAAERAADGPGNKGREAAAAAVEMATLFRRLDGGASA
jgi:6,7-dimethyl-8-ribityllumazine synthase